MSSEISDLKVSIEIFNEFSRNEFLVFQNMNGFQKFQISN